MNDWLGRDDDGDGIPNAIDADPDTPAPAQGSSIVEDAGPTPLNRAPVDAPPPDASPSDARPPDAPAGPGTTPLTLPPMPTPPTAPADPTDISAMQKFQAEMQEYSMLMEVYSNLLKQLEDAEREIAKNTR